MINKAAIQAVISDLKSQKAFNFTQTAKKYTIQISTLLCHFKGKSVSYCKAHLRSNKLLNNV